MSERAVLPDEGTHARHIISFLRWVELCREVDAVCEQHMDFIEYRGYRLWQLICAHPLHRPKMNAMTNSMHEQCLGTAKGGSECRTIRVEDERAIVVVSQRLMVDPSYNADVAARFSPSVMAYVAPPKPVTHCTTTLLRNTRARRGSDLCAQHLPAAVWKARLGVQLTVLEAFLVSKRGLGQLGLEHERELLARWKRYAQCYKNARLCRGCLRIAKRVAHPLACVSCKRVYFCSSECKHDGFHSVECSLLKKQG